jgi:phage-related protein
MQSVGSGVQEIRLRGEHGDHYRVMYIAKWSSR